MQSFESERRSSADGNNARRYAILSATFAFAAGDAKQRAASRPQRIPEVYKLESLEDRDCDLETLSPLPGSMDIPKGIPTTRIPRHPSRSRRKRLPKREKDRERDRSD